MSDGIRLRQSWYNALGEAEANFKQLLASHSSVEWKRLSLSGDSTSPPKGKTRAGATPDLADVVVHRKASKSGDSIYRLVLDAPHIDEAVSLDAWKAVLTTPEMRQEWDPAVERAQLVEMFDHRTRVSKTSFTLGWPANPRDAVAISRLYQDSSTVIDISTSLPRSPDEPRYLRPSPPYVRSNVALYAWCVQLIQPSAPQSPQPTEALRKKLSTAPRLRITCFWQHDLRSMWNISTNASICQQLSTMMVGLYKTVKARGSRIPMLTGYGYGISIERIRFQLDRQALTLEYTVHPEDEEHGAHAAEDSGGVSELDVIKEHRRLTRSIECVLPPKEGWDVQITTKASSEKVETLPWTLDATQKRSVSNKSTSEPIVFKVAHSPLPDDTSILKVRCVIELSGPSSGIRLNGIPKSIQPIEERDPSAFMISQGLLQDVSGSSFQTESSVASSQSAGSVKSNESTASAVRPQMTRMLSERSAVAEKSILSRVRRSYIYFSSLLQEPEAKWKRTTDARGVSVTQLDSIDPTLVVYRAEATFVGVGLWDLFGALMSPGARVYWDKQHEDATLLEDVNELTQLWHFRTKPAWPVNGRDAVLLRTVYKSPTTIHVFAFSADDPYLFPNIPQVDLNVIRTQVDLQGWAIEALSPSTTQLTLLEQSDPKGWSNKASIPQQMINAVAGVGEYTIKCGGPPVVTRLSGAKANEIRYDHERGMLRVEYEKADSRRNSPPMAGPDVDKTPTLSTTTQPQTIECELRCDLDAWAAALDIVADPPPQNVTCLRRHRLSAGGGGLWLSLTHDAMFASDDRLQIIVRRGPSVSGKDKGTVMVNGAKVSVDIEELAEQEIKALTKQKRIKPVRVPLDQPPVVNAVRRRKAEWGVDSAEATPRSATPVSSAGAEPSQSPGVAAAVAMAASSSTGWLSAPRFSSPLTSFWSSAVESATTSTQQAVAAISPVVGVSLGEGAEVDSSRTPMQHAVNALHAVHALQSDPSPDGWTLVSDKGIAVQRKVVPSISSSIPVHRGEKVIEGVAAEEIASVVTSYDCRKQWDDRFDSASVLEAFDAKCHAAFVVSKGGFPFRDRGFYLASLVARARLPPASVSTPTGDDGAHAVSDSGSGLGATARTVTICVATSFSPDSAAHFAQGKYNAYNLPIGRVFVDAWVLETLDPYTKENYMIPSTRCTRIVAVDYAGSIPAAVNMMINGTLSRSVLALEAYMKTLSPSPLMRLPAPGLVLAEAKDAAPESQAWKLRRRDDSRVLIASQFTPEDRVYTSVLLLTTGGVAPPPPLSLSASASRAEENAGNVLGSGSSASATPLNGTGNGDASAIAADVRSDRTEMSSPTASVFSASASGSVLDRRRAASVSQTQIGAHVRAATSTGSPPTATALAAPATAPRAGTLGRNAGQQLRSSSSAFTLKGEVKQPTDLIVAEIVVDCKLYPEGYEAQVYSRPRASGSASAAGGGARHVALQRPKDLLHVLPITYAVYTVPASPLHSSGLSADADRAPRHLLRLSLPTAQYQVSTVEDPLTGEMRSAPPKPPWLVDLQEKGFIVDVRIKPAAAAARRGSFAVTVDGESVQVVTEKESLTTLGRDELQDDKVARMAVLTRVNGLADAFPEELKTPIGLADHLFDASAVIPANDTADEAKTSEAGTPTSEEGQDGSTDQDVPGKGTATTGPAAAASSGGLLGFLNAYPNPLTRWASGSGAAKGGSPPHASGNGSSSDGSSNSGSGSGHAGRSAEADARRGKDGRSTSLQGGALATANQGQRKTGGKGGSRKSGGVGNATATATATLSSAAAGLGEARFSLWMVMMIAVIAFLIGSLLRSLLSPADFIYVVSDLAEAEEMEAGWREIKRLVEVKYIVGGWDFQIAVVRRH